MAPNIDSPQLDALCAKKATVVIDATGPTIVWSRVVATPTAGHHVRTVTLGSSVLSLDIPNVRFDTAAEGATLTQLCEAAHVFPEVGQTFEPYPPEQQAQYTARDEALTQLGHRWADRLVALCDSAETLDEHSREVCTTCGGVGAVSTKCWCTLGQRFVHTHQDGTEEQVWLRSGVDPKCDVCKGLGLLPRGTCDGCHGVGSIVLVPTLTLHTTQGSQTIPLDVCALVRNRLVTVSAETASYETWAQITLRFDTAPLYLHLSREDQTVSPLVMLGPQVTLNSRLVPLAPLHFRFDAAHGKFAQTFGGTCVDPDLLETPDFATLLAELQQNLAYTTSWFPFPSEKFFKGVVEGRKIVNGTVVGLEAEVLPWEGVETTVEQLAFAAAARGLTLGLSQTFIATGETAPAVFLLNEGKTVAQLGDDYVWACALAQSAQLLRGLEYDK